MCLSLPLPAHESHHAKATILCSFMAAVDISYLAVFVAWLKVQIHVTSVACSLEGVSEVSSAFFKCTEWQPNWITSTCIYISFLMAISNSFKYNT